MSGDQSDQALKEIIWPPSGMVHEQEELQPVLCKPKLIPLKSVTLEKLERMQREALAKLKELEEAERKESAANATGDSSAAAERAPTKAADIWSADD